MIDPAKVMAEVERRKRDLEETIFRTPPRNFEEFQFRLGSWLELNKTSDWLGQILKKADEDEEKDI